MIYFKGTADSTRDHHNGQQVEYHDGAFWWQNDAASLDFDI